MDYDTFRTDPRRAFLDRIPLGHRPVVASVFYEAADSATTPIAVLHRVEEQARAALAQIPSDVDHPLIPLWMLLLAKLQLHPEEATGFADFALDYAQLSPEQRRAIQAAKTKAVREARQMALSSADAPVKGVNGDEGNR